MTAHSLAAPSRAVRASLPGGRRLAVMGLALLLLAGGPAAAQQAQQAQPAPHDRSKPIEIVADTLTVQQEQQLATFTGNVEAVQGEMTLRADVLRVFYTQRREDGSAGSAGAAPAIGGQNAIRRIEAEGHVFLSSPRETAQGDAGTYDVAAAKVTLEGNVVLTQNENVVKGASLDMDLTTGVSTVRSAPGAPRGERVRARFVPARGS